jgi:hypothetical protein
MFLDGMQLGLTHGEGLLALPANIRFRVNAPVLPARPYRITGWQILTQLPGAEPTTMDLPAKLLQMDDPKQLRQEKIELPAFSTLVMNFEIHELEKRKFVDQKWQIEKHPIAQGEYALRLTMLLIPLASKEVGENIQCQMREPVVVFVYKDLPAKDSKE